MGWFDWFQGQETVIQTIAIYALLAFSVQVPIRAGTFSLAGIGFYGVGSYSAAYCALHGRAAIVGIGLGLVISGVIGWLMALALTRLRELYLAMATVAFDLMVGVLALNWVSVTGGPTGLYSIPVQLSVSEVVLMLLVVAVILLVLESGVIGRMSYATRDDEPLAQSLAIDTNRYRRFAFVLSALLGSLAGACHALTFYSINPDDVGFNLVILILAMVIIGGFTSWFGALLGAALLTWVPLHLTSLGEWWPVVYGLGLVVMAVYLPQGIWGLGQQLFRRGCAMLRQARSSKSPATVPDRLAL